MEALLERGEEQVESWNDDRLDELSGRMDEGFKEMREGFARIDRKFERAEERFASKEELHQRFDAVGVRFDKVESQLLHLSERFDRLLNTLVIGTIGVVAALLANGI